MKRGEMLQAFRDRLSQVLADSGLSRTAFARASGTDRSTLTQLLSERSTRLPRAETIVGIAAANGISVDWLLGLSNEGQQTADVVSELTETSDVGFEADAASPADERLRDWQTQAIGYKIRYVPTTLPQLLKTEEVIRYEFNDSYPVAPQRRIEQAEEVLEYSRLPETDMEACSSVQALTTFALGEGVWHDLGVEARRDALVQMRRLVAELYPTFRWFLFDGKSHFSVPLTVYGPMRAIIYLGEKYLVLNGTEHVRALSAHFDELIRAATVQPTDVAALIDRLLRRLR